MQQRLQRPIKNKDDIVWKIIFVTILQVLAGSSMADSETQRRQRQLIKSQNIAVHAMPPLPVVATEADFDKESKKQCGTFEITMFQHLLEFMMSRYSPHRGLLVYHGLGVGKTCTAISIAEAFLADKLGTYQQDVWVILSTALANSFKGQLFNTAHLVDNMGEQCTRDTYIKMVYEHSDTKDKTLQKVAQAIDKRYRFFTYEEFGTYIQGLKKPVLRKVMQNKLIIVDEAHNLRNESRSTSVALMSALKEGSNNRLVLLTATPMFNEPDEILQLLEFLVVNDHRTDDIKLTNRGNLINFYDRRNGQLKESTVAIFTKLCENYVSYVMSNNPFKFPARLSPEVDGVPVMKDMAPAREFNNRVSRDRAWVRQVPEGLVPSVMSEIQERIVKASIRMQRDNHPEDDGMVATGLNGRLLLLNNIVYPNDQGELRADEVVHNGFFNICTGSPLGSTNVEYTYAKGVQWFTPTEDLLGKISTKMLTVVRHIEMAEGVVCVYSNFIRDGILPIALALEHLGYKRYNEPNLLKGITSPTRRTSGPSYCILCGDSMLSGNARIAKYMNVLKSKENAKGEQIKVILMSPIAGEGLSFMNVRQVHILDPWYHYNRIEQVIGRSLRTCSHIALPLSKRNVTVFLHTTAYRSDDSMETYDMHAYKIATRKFLQTRAIEDIVKRHAFDCALQKHVNYVPSTHFPFEVSMKTAAGTTFSHRFGDTTASSSPSCHHELERPYDKDAWRRDTYRHLLPTLRKKLVELLKNIHKGGGLTLNALESHFAGQFPKEVLVDAMMSLHGKEISDTDTTTTLIIYHRGALRVVHKKQPLTLVKVPVPSPQGRQRRPSQSPSTSSSQVAVGPVAARPVARNFKHPMGAAVARWLGGDSEYADLIAQLLTEGIAAKNDANALLPLLLITNTEGFYQALMKVVLHPQAATMPTWKAMDHLLSRYGFIVHQTNAGIHGYINVFSAQPVAIVVRRDDSKASIQEAVNYRMATPQEKTQILTERRNKYPVVDKPSAESVRGFLSVTDKTIVLKIVKPEKGKQDRKGIVATSMKVDEMRRYLRQLQSDYQRQFGRPMPDAPEIRDEDKGSMANKKNLTSLLAYHLWMNGKLHFQDHDQVVHVSQLT
jgi:superfamily II DNA or RNA helicase